MVVVRELNATQPFKYEQHINVYRIDHISRRWFYILTAVVGVIGLIGTLKTLGAKGKT